VGGEFEVEGLTTENTETQRKRDSMSEEIMERIKKLQELAARGVGGEKVNARIMLERAMLKYGVTESDLDSELKKQIWFKYSSKWQRALLIQIIAYVCGDKINIFGAKKVKEVVASMTPGQHIEVELMFDAHKRAFAKEEEIFFRAYIQKNMLFPRDAEQTERKYTPEQVEEIKKMLKVMDGIDRVHVKKQIGG
jgi:hypothetical protein